MQIGKIKVFMLGGWEMNVKYKTNIGAARVHFDIIEGIEEILSNSHSLEYPDYSHFKEFQQVSDAVYSFILMLIEKGLIDEEWEENIITYTDDYVNSRTTVPRKPTQSHELKDGEE